MLACVSIYLHLAFGFACFLPLPPILSQRTLIADCFFTFILPVLFPFSDNWQLIDRFDESWLKSCTYRGEGGNNNKAKNTHSYSWKLKIKKIPRRIGECSKKNWMRIQRNKVMQDHIKTHGHTVLQLKVQSHCVLCMHLKQSKSNNGSFKPS